MLQLEHIAWETPEGVSVLNDVSLTVPDNKLVVITGPNGGGKTTLAKIIAGLVQPTSGRIILDGTDITGADVTERANMGISYAFQQPVRFKGLTVRQLLELAAGGKIEYSAICDILARVGLCAREYVNREVNATLSGGEIKRIEIASVIARNTKLSVFDEPEAGIDLWSFSNLIDAFKKMREDISGTLLIISHQERILRIADEIAVIAGGTVSASGDSDTMMERLMSGGDYYGVCSKQEELLS